LSERVLIVEDEAAIRLALKGVLKKAGYDVTLAPTGEAAIAAFEQAPFDLVLTDLSLGAGMSGMDVLEACRAARPSTPVVLITAHGSERTAVQAMQSGAADYVPKPFDNDEIRLVVRRALERTRLEREHRLLLERIQREYGFGALIGSGPKMQQVFETIQKVAQTHLTVLIRGESGTGKELVAQALHERSGRRDRPFVAVNCASISTELVESELFGHERGAFTGANARRIGRFEAADGGTIFLDEIGDMAPATQAKVLRVLQERCFERVGGDRRIDVDVRVLAATHRDLEADVRDGRFRQDLYYRLKVVEVMLPPMRDRVEDVPALVGRFVSLLAERLKRSPVEVSDAAMAALARHDWPGNVRELRNVVEQAAVLASDNRIQPADLSLRPGVAGSEPVPLDLDMPFRDAKRRAVQDFERRWLSAALDRHDGNISRTAAAIGMVRQSLQQKLTELGLRGNDR